MTEQEYANYLRQVRDAKETREAREWNYPRLPLAEVNVIMRRWGMV